MDLSDPTLNEDHARCPVHDVELIAAVQWGFDPRIGYAGIRSAEASTVFPFAKWGHPLVPEEQAAAIRFCTECELERAKFLASRP